MVRSSFEGDHSSPLACLLAPLGLLFGFLGALLGSLGASGDPLGCLLGCLLGQIRGKLRSFKKVLRSSSWTFPGGSGPLGPCQHCSSGVISASELWLGMSIGVFRGCGL